MAERGPIYGQKGDARGTITLSGLERLVRLPIPPIDPIPSRWHLAALHSNFVSQGILVSFFGRDWAEKNSFTAAKNSFLRGRPQNEQAWGEHIIRVRGLAELIYNMQAVRGLDDVLDQIRDRMLSSGYAELEIGKLLMRNNIRFWYVETSGVKGFDFELEFVHPRNGKLCCGEVKSKNEDTVLGENTIYNSLREARDQLPPDQPGFIFLKVPQKWYEAPELVATVSKAIASLKSQRIVSVVLFSNVLEYGEDDTGVTSLTTHPIIEFESPYHKFGSLSDRWKVFVAHDPRLPNPAGWVNFEQLCYDIGARFIDKIIR
jgi:hypothetical protein